MKYILLFALFAPILYLAFRQKKWYLYLMFAFVSFLPDQLAIKIHDSLPLLSASRSLILLVLVFWLFDRWKKKNFSVPLPLAIYLGINVLISIINLSVDLGEINRIFRYVLERVFLAVMITDMTETREELETGIDFLILGCMAVCCIGIAQTVFNYDIASVLQVQFTFETMPNYPRMGLTRSFGTMNPIAFGCYNAFMCLPIYYRLEQTGKQRYAIAFAVNFVSLICTFTRSAWLCIAGIAFLLLIFRRMKFIRRMLTSLVYILVLCGILCCFQPRLYAALTETAKSSINTIIQIFPGVDTDSDTNSTDPTDNNDATNSTEETDPEDKKKPHKKPGFALSEDFGLNASDPTYSRTAQWTAITYMIQEDRGLFGYGYNGYVNGRIHYLYNKWTTQWMVAPTLDVGWVASATECGLIGMTSHILLVGYLFVRSLRKRSRGGQFTFHNMFCYLAVLYVLLNILASFLHDSVVWQMIGLFFAYEKLERKGLLVPQTPAEPLPPSGDLPQNAPLVSIYVPTFNHENYIAQALDSIRMQQVNFSYEVYVGEDCSTDNTRQVLQAWEQANPDPRFHILYRDHNMYKDPISNALDLKNRCTGKYIICLEGDDYWLDPSKLQQQVDFLEQHPDYYAVAHNCLVVDENSQPNGETYPQCGDEEYTIRHFASDILPGQYATMLSRNYMTDPDLDRSLLNITGGAGDRRVYFSILFRGKIHCIQKALSAYRHITGQGTSFSATHQYRYDAQELYNRQFLTYAYQQDRQDMTPYAELIYLRNIRYARRMGYIDSARAKKDMANIRNLCRAKRLLLKRDINYRILHKTIHV